VNDQEILVQEPTPPTGQARNIAKPIEAAVYLICIVIGIGGILQAKDLPNALPVGPGLVPIIACSLLGLLSLAGLIGLLRNADGESPRLLRDGRAGLILLLMVGYIVLLQLLPFLVATLILSVVWYAVSLGRPSAVVYLRQWPAWLGIVVFVVAVYLVFTDVLNVSFI
jgi:hypothetical protein